MNYTNLELQRRSGLRMKLRQSKVPVTKGKRVGTRESVTYFGVCMYPGVVQSDLDLYSASFVQDRVDPIKLDVQKKKKNGKEMLYGTRIHKQHGLPEQPIFLVATVNTINRK